MPSEMEQSTSTQAGISPALGFSFGVCLIILAGVGFMMAGKIQSIGFQDPSDPGPRFFPQTLLFFLALSGIIESVIHGRRLGLKFGNPQSTASIEELAEGGQAFKKRYLVTGITSMAFLVLVMPWIGFPLASILFLSMTMPVLGIPWKLAILYALGMTAVIWLVFVWGLQAPLPRGVLW